MMFFRTQLINFDNRVLYEGSDPNKAIGAAVDSGFESVVTNVSNGVTCFYSPITGWRGKMLVTNSSGNCRHANDDTC